MKSGIPWSIRGIDDETREAAEEAARLAGMSLGEWLRDTIAERAAEEGVHPEVTYGARGRDDDDARAVAETLADLVDRVRAMNAGARSAAGGLKERLDQIEAELARVRDLERRSGGGTGSLRGVAAIVDRLSRELDDIDETARSTVEGRRAGSGPSPSRADEGLAEAIRNLNAQIAAMAERLKPETAREPSFQDVRDRLNSLLARAPEPTPTPASSLEATLRSLEARIGEAKGRPPRQPQASSEDDDERIRRIRTQLGDITRKLGERRSAASSRPVERPADIAALQAEIAALSARVEDLTRSAGKREDHFAGSIALEATLLDRFDNLLRRLPNQDRLDALGNELAALRASLERGDLRSIQRLESQMIELAGRVEAELRAREAAAEASAAAIAATLADLRAAVEDLVLDRGASADPGTLAGLAADLQHVRAAVDGLEAARRGDAKAVTRIEARLDEIASGVATGTKGSEGLAAIGRIEERLDRIAASVDGVLARTPAPDLVASIDQRLDSLSREVAKGPAQDVPSAALEEIRAQMDAIRGDLVRRDTPGAEDAEDRTGEPPVAPRAVDPSQLDRLEARIARIATAFDRAMPRGETLRRVEEDLTRLQADLAQGTTEPVPPTTPVDVADPSLARDLIGALRADLASVRTTREEGDGPTEATMQSLKGGLATIVDRLDELETGPARTGLESVAPASAGASTPAPAETPSGETPPRVAPMVTIFGPAIPTGEPSPPKAPVEGRYTRRPSEPRVVRPDLAALRELAASAPEPERKAGDRRADFIAAARRAAQAEADAGTGVGPGDRSGPLSTDPKHSPFARIGQAIRNRRKSLLLAAAAIVLAVGAVYIFGQRTSRISELAGIAPARNVPAAEATPAKPPPADEAAPTPVPPTDQPLLVAPSSDARTAMALAADDAIQTQSIGAATVPPGGTGGFVETDVAADAAPQPVASLVAPGLPAALRDAASTGDPAAAFEIAARYADGRDTPQNLSQAAAWYERAAGGGIIVAEFRLGSLYERGQGVRQDTARAIALYQRAAGAGNVQAMHNLAVLLSKGNAGAADLGKALEWFLIAASYGVKDSQYNLGVVYARGLGVNVDLAEAYKWFAIAALGGDADAAARRDEAAGMLSPDQVAAGEAAVRAWRAKTPLVEANAAPVPDASWGDGTDVGVTAADQKALVMKIQTLLAERGYDPGPADGVEGAKTREAVRAFQKTIGVESTGVIDASLVTALAERPG